MSALDSRVAVPARRSELEQHTDELNELAAALHSRITTLSRSDCVRPRAEGNDSLNALEDKLFRCIFAVRKVKNTSLPVNRLPPEILSYIFGLVQKPLRSISDWRCHVPSYTFVNVADIRPITEVCQHWREVAINTPSLWSSVVDSTFVHYIRRCVSGPIYVYLHEDVTMKTLEMIRNNSSRVRVLRMHEYGLKPDLIDALVVSPLTGVEECCVISGSGRNHRQYPELMRPLFASCDNLRSLYLERAPFLPSNNFPRLAHLDVSNPHWKGDLGTFLHGMLALLTRTPALRTLHVQMPPEASASSTVDSKWADQRVELNMLDKLSLPGSDSTYTRTSNNGPFKSELLSHIHTPRIRSIYLGGCNPREMHPVLVAAADVWREKRASHMHVEVAQTPVTPNAYLTLNATTPTRSERMQMNASEPWTRQTGDDAAEEMIQGLRHVLAFPLFSTLRYLWIEHRYSLWTLLRDGCSFLPALPHLESLGLANRDTELLRVGTILADLEVPDSGHLTCPLLRSLLVDCMEDREVDYVKELARSRALAGSPIDRRLVIGLLSPNTDWLAVELGFKYQYKSYDYNSLGERTTDISRDICTAREFWAQ